MTINCASCDRQRNSLTQTSSVLLPGVPLLLCTDCISKGFEPRWVIIMAGRQYGNEAVTKHVSKKLYSGPTIALEEVV